MEQKQIILTSVVADKNPEYRVNSGNDTIDRVFLLSIPEVKEYFDSDEARICAATDYAKTKGAKVSDSIKTAEGKAACRWWLRSPGDKSTSASLVFGGGSVNSFGQVVDHWKECIRPALWMDLEIPEEKIN